ncbi:MAG: NAD-binding protein [Candidatus Hodarchaeota archaeon]
MNIRKKIIKLKILFKQNWFVFTVFIAWFFVNFLIFTLTGNLMEAILYTFYFSVRQDYYGHFYFTISGFVIFGWIVSLVTTELYRKYYPEQTCIALSRAMTSHTIIIGYSNLGKRIVKYLRRKQKRFVIIEDNRALVSDLIEGEEPVVPKKAHNIEVLSDANVKKARLILNTKNDIETLVVATDLIREVNKDCKIVCRCFDDSLAQILEKNLRCETISTSKYASERLFEKIKEVKAKNVLLIGCTNTTRRLMEQLKAERIDYKIIEREREVVEDIIDEEPVIIGDAKDSDVLKEGGIASVDLVSILIDSAEEALLISDEVRILNENCQLICRFFHEEVAEILEKAPFNAFVISTSQHTLEKMIESGVFDGL